MAHLPVCGRQGVGECSRGTWDAVGEVVVALRVQERALFFFSPVSVKSYANKAINTLSHLGACVALELRVCAGGIGILSLATRGTRSL